MVINRLLVCMLLCSVNGWGQILDSCLQHTVMRKRNYENELHSPRFNANKQDALVDYAGGGDVEIMDSKFYIPANNEPVAAYHRYNSDTVHQMKDGSRMITLGFAPSKSLKGGKVMRRVSFKFRNSYQIGDTAVFHFKILSEGGKLFKGSGFCPYISFSDNIITKNNIIRNMKSFDEKGQLDTESKGKNHIVDSYFRIVVDKKFLNYQWIHLTLKPDDWQVGFILGLCNEWNEKDSVETKQEQQVPKVEYLYFQNASSILSENEKQKLTQIMSYAQYNNSLIQISGFADPSGKVEDNLVLASERVQAVRKYLIDEGITESFIQIGELGIADFGSEIENRVCIVRVIH